MFLDVAYASALFDQTKVVYVMQCFKIMVYFAISVITIWEMLPLHGRVWKCIREYPAHVCSRLGNIHTLRVPQGFLAF